MARGRGLLALAIVTPVVLVAGSVYFVTGATQLGAAQAVATIPQPQGWVAFDADYIDYEQGRDPYVTGRYHRAGDGSLRQEARNGDRTRGLVHIVNIARKTAYFYTTSNQKWTTQPVEIPSEGYLAPQTRWRVNTRGLGHLSELYNGLDVYEYRDVEGDLHIKAPALNFFTVRKSTPATGRTLEFRNIQLRPQSADLFMPPSDVTVFEKLDEPLAMRYLEKSK